MRFFSFLIKNSICNYKIITNKFCGWRGIFFAEDGNGGYNVITKLILGFKWCFCPLFVKCNYVVIMFLFGVGVCFSGTVLAKNISLDILSDLSQGGLFYGKTEDGADVFVNGSPVFVTPSGEFVFAIAKDAPTEITLSAVKNNYKISKTYDVSARLWKEEVVNGLPSKKVLPSQTDLKRIADENNLLKQARKQTTYDKFPTCFIRPVHSQARISSAFGSMRVLNGVKSAGHSGTDYALPMGSPIYAPADGVVKVVHSDMFYSGKTILIDHGYGVFSSYSHLSDILVEQGEKIKQGHLIGKIGTSGRSTGPHLHLTITWFGVRVDPEFVLSSYACEK